MASKTPGTKSASKAEAPATAPATKPAVVAKLASKPIAETLPSPVAEPVAKKVAVKAAPTKVAAPAKVAEKIEKATVTTVETVMPIVENVRAVATKEENIMEATIKSAAEKAKTLFADANAKSTKAFEEFNEFSKGNIEAMVESSKIAAKGIETMGQDVAEYSRKQFEGATAALKSLSSVKSPADFFKLHSDYVRTSFDSLVAQSSKNTEAMLKLAGEVAQPISNRVAVAVEKVKIAA